VQGYGTVQGDHIMFKKMIERMIENSGPKKFIIIYSLIFTLLINSMGTLINDFMGKPSWSLQELIINIIMSFVFGVIISKQLVKRMSSK